MRGKRLHQISDELADVHVFNAGQQLKHDLQRDELRIFVAMSDQLAETRLYLGEGVLNIVESMQYQAQGNHLGLADESLQLSEDAHKEVIDEGRVVLADSFETGEGANVVLLAEHDGDAIFHLVLER